MSVTAAHADTPCHDCRVAVIGAGRIAHEHVKAFRDIPGVNIVGVCSRTESKARQFAVDHGIPLAAPSIKNLYQRTEADLVVVTVNEVATHDITHQCLEFPWTIFIEKPPGLNFSEACRISESVCRENRRVYVAMNRQSYAVTRHVRAALDTRNSQRFIHVYDQEDPVAAARAGKPARSVSHWMYANSIHLVDYFRLLARGQAINVQQILSWSGDQPGVLLARIDFSSGDIGIYEANWQIPGPWAVSVALPNERWELRPLEKGTYQRLGEQPIELPTHEWDHRFKPGFRYQAEHAVAAARGEKCDLPTVHDVLPTMKLIRDIYLVD